MSAAAHALPLPAVPFEGRISYCLAKSLKMLLDHQGQHFPLPFLESVGTETFGFIYVPPPAGIAVLGHPYHIAGERMLRRLGFQFDNPSFDAPEPALAALGAALEHGPVALGMLDMGFLTYDPDCARKRGADHAVVALELRKDAVVVHDPDGYVAVPLPLPDLLRAWKAEGIYTGKSYMLWRIGRRAVRSRPGTYAAPCAASMRARASACGFFTPSRCAASSVTTPGKTAPRSATATPAYGRR